MWVSLNQSGESVGSKTVFPTASLKRRNQRMPEAWKEAFALARIICSFLAKNLRQSVTRLGGQMLDAELAC